MGREHLEGCARRLHALADEARSAAARVAALSTVDWKSLAANRFRSALRREAALANRCADALDDAARAVVAHARAVGQ